MIFLKILANLVLGGAALIELIFLIAIAIVGYIVYRTIQHFWDFWNDF